MASHAVTTAARLKRVRSSVYRRHPGLGRWLRGDSAGLSAKTIVVCLTGLDLLGRWDRFPPVDGHDFKNCLSLLKAVPSLRPLLPQMAGESTVWARLVQHWSTLEALVEAGKMTEAYHFIQPLVNPDPGQGAG